MAETALTSPEESPARIAGLRGIAADWSSDQRAFKNVSWGKELPVVYRWAYDYSVPGAAQDFIPQNQPRGATRAVQGAAP